MKVRYGYLKEFSQYVDESDISQSKSDMAKGYFPKGFYNELPRFVKDLLDDVNDLNNINLLELANKIDNIVSGDWLSDGVLKGFFSKVSRYKTSKDLLDGLKDCYIYLLETK